MLEFCLLPLMWSFDPVAQERSARNVATIPISTCVRPIVKVIERDASHASFPRRGTDAVEITSWLTSWENATHDDPGWSRSQHEEFRRTIHREFNEHTAVAVEKLVGRVSADWLNTTYDWKIVERTGERVSLEATPRDETDRLFCRSFRVSLAATDGSPDRIVVVGRNQHQRTVWQSDRPSTVDEIQFVNFVEDTPPAPRPLLRTVDARVD